MKNLIENPEVKDRKTNILNAVNYYSDRGGKLSESCLYQYFLTLLIDKTLMQDEEIQVAFMSVVTTHFTSPAFFKDILILKSCKILELMDANRIDFDESSENLQALSKFAHIFKGGLTEKPL